MHLLHARTDPAAAHHSTLDDAMRPAMSMSFGNSGLLLLVLARKLLTNAKISSVLSPWRASLQDTMVSDIMRPRVEVVALEASTDIATFVGAVSSTGNCTHC
jgi:hypothetical protein